MKTMLRFLHYLAPVIVVLAGEYTVRGIPVPNLLADPGFESGTPVASGMGGWGELNGAVFSQTYAHAGLWSLKDPFSSGNINVSGFQIVPAAAGSLFDVSGWGLTPTTLSAGGQGLLLVDFLDSSQNLINSGGTVFYEMGSLTSSTPTQTWTSLSGSVTAPAGTAYIEVEAELFNGAAGDSVYFDDLSVTAVPEPAPVILLTTALGFVFIGSRMGPITTRSGSSAESR